MRASKSVYSHGGAGGESGTVTPPVPHEAEEFAEKDPGVVIVEEFVEDDVDENVDDDVTDDSEDEGAAVPGVCAAPDLAEVSATADSCRSDCWISAFSGASMLGPGTTLRCKSF
jgi:hypothetical protein